MIIISPPSILSSILSIKVRSELLLIFFPKLFILMILFRNPFLNNISFELSLIDLTGLFFLLFILLIIPFLNIFDLIPLLSSFFDAFLFIIISIFF